MLLERLENRLCLSTWSEPVNLGPIVNSSSDEADPALSPDGLSLYFFSNRPGGFGTSDIWASRRASLTDPWGTPQNLGPVINYPGSGIVHPNLSSDGHRLFFASNRPGGYGGYDLWASWRDDTHDDFSWQTPVNLGPAVNTSSTEFGPAYFEDGGTGVTKLYFSSDRPGGLGDYDIYASTLQSDGTFGAANLVPELSSPYPDRRPTIRGDGREMFLVTNRPGQVGSGLTIWVSKRATTSDAWSPPVELGTPINGPESDARSPALSADGNTMVFFSTRPGGQGSNDLWMSTRLPLVADHFTLSAPASATAGQTTSLTLTAWDNYGNIATGYTGTVTFASSDPQARLPASYAFTANDQGTHTFDGALLTAGGQSITVTDQAGEVIAARVSIAVNPAAADHFLIMASATAVSDTPFDVTVMALDPYGNIDTNYQGTVTLSTTDPDQGVVLPADYTFTTDDGGDNGVHTFQGGITLVTAGDQTLTVADKLSGIAGSATITVGPGP
jgi:Tol biopolymer transport system component